MGRITSSVGLITGIPIEETVNKLMELQQRPVQQLVNRTDRLKNEQAALADLTARLLTVQFAFRRLSQESVFEKRDAVSQDPGLISASALGRPPVGTYQFVPVRQAQAQQLLTQGFIGKDALVGSGSISFRQGRKVDEGISLSLLNGGRGVQRGKIRITDRSGGTADVDLRFAQTIDDVLTTINSATDVSVRAELSGDRIRLVDLTGQTSRNLRVQEIGVGGTAQGLGLSEINTGQSVAEGSDVLSLFDSLSLEDVNDGRGIRVDGSLADLRINFRDGSSPLQIDFGSPISAESQSTVETSHVNSGANLRFTAVSEGGAFDDVRIRFVENDQITLGNETVAFDSSDENHKELVFQIAAGKTTADHIVAAVGRDDIVSKLFTVEKTSPLTNASGVTSSESGDARIRFTVKEAGITGDDINIRFVDVADVVAGQETVVFDDTDPENKRLTIGIDAGFTTADDVINAVNGDANISQLFSASLAEGLQRASATTEATNGIDAKVTITANNPGPGDDGIEILFVDDSSVVKGEEVVQYDEIGKKLTFRIENGKSTAADIVRAVVNDPAISELFSASIDTEGSGQGVVTSADSGVTSGGASGLVDIKDSAITFGGASGIISSIDGGTTSGGAGNEVLPERTLGEILNTINNADPARIRAEISSDGDRIVLQDLTEGSGSFRVDSLNDSRAAEDLGLLGNEDGTGRIEGKRLFGGLKTVLLESLNGGRGIGPLGTIQITDRSGSSATVDLSQAQTLEDVLQKINATSAVSVSAEINETGNGIELQDTSGVTDGNFVIVSADEDYQTAEKLQIKADQATNVIGSGDLHLQIVSEATRLESLNNGAGVSKNSFIITDSTGRSEAVNLANPAIETIGDLIQDINSLSINVQARVNDSGDGILLLDQGGGGATLAVREFNGGSAAGDLNLLSPAAVLEIEKSPVQAIDGSFAKKLEFDNTTTLADVAEQINSLGIGLTANILKDGSGSAPFRLSIIGRETGKSTSYIVDSSESSVQINETSKAQDALMLFGASGIDATNGTLVSATSNRFDEVVDGLSLTLNGTSTRTISVSVSASSEALGSSLEDLVTKYNDLQDKLAEYTLVNEDSVIDSGVLHGSSIALRIQAEIPRLLTGLFSGSSSVNSFAEVGINFNDSGKLRFDKDRLTSQFNSNRLGVKDFFRRPVENSEGEEVDLGAAKKLDDLLEAFVGENSSAIISRAQAVNQKVGSNEKRIDVLNARLAVKRERLLREFTNMELAVGKLQGNLQALQAFSPVAPIASVKR